MTGSVASRVAPADYWERRAERYAGEGAGLRAVCSYGMPSFYNSAIELTQTLAMAPHLTVEPGTRVLDLGCGIGRWSRRLAANGAEVTGVDLSPTMIAEASRRALDDGVEARCRFVVGDVATLGFDGAFDRVVCVTVLQHVLDDADRHEALLGIARALRPGGKAVLLEAAPTQPWRASDHAQFRPRTLGQHLDSFREVGLTVRSVSGVDSTLVRKYLLPAHRHLPTWLAVPLLAAGTAVALPLDIALARMVPRWSWHKLFVLERPES